MFIANGVTDIAMLGIWDAGVPADDLGQKSFEDYMSTLEADARHGQLIYVNTYSDGFYPMGAVISKAELPQDTLDWYRRVDRTLFLKTHTGRVLIGGLEDYRCSKPQITSESDVFKVTPGIYKVIAYQLTDDEERITEQIKSQVGSEEYEYYASRSDGCGIAVLIFIAGVITSFFWSWWAIAIAAALSIAYAVYRNSVNSKDERYQAVKQAIEDWDAEHPVLLFVFERVDGMQKSDGYFDLDYSVEQDT